MRNLSIYSTSHFLFVDLPRPSEWNLLQPKAKSISPQPPPPTDEPPFHKPLNTDGQEHDSINMNKVTNPKDIDQVPKVDLKESEGPPEPSPLYKKIRSLVPSLELDCLYTYKEITTATNGFSEEYILGTGTFGTVYYGKIKRTDCAIKKLTKVCGTTCLSLSPLYISSMGVEHSGE